ncbi:MAG: hypothetical protein JO158_10870 [Gammaproteobacteria bacterium]|nr:hypothetical protein [Gammaproteobacteria bacterium]MBV9724221.1 hypothetical protein [Gammaproteobacteria bacterium]
MTMMQLIVATALGFIVAQSGLYGVRHSLRWLQRVEVGTRVRTLPGQVIVSGFIRYAAPIGATAALITLGVWALGDYLAAKAARNAALANALDSAPAVGAAQAQGSADDGVGSGASAGAEPAIAAQPESGDPYADPDYKVHRRARRAGAPLSLKETLLQRSEAKARAELLRDMQQHASRSQYDCEAADHAARYLKAGLDVWGFAAWQLKYFPAEGYNGATLAGCKDIPNVVDPSQLDLQSTVAQEHH